MDVKVRSVSFDPDGVVIEYFEWDDVKANGAVRQQAVMIPGDTLAIDELEELDICAERALKAVLEGWPSLEVAEREDDDEPGYDNPREREDHR